MHIITYTKKLPAFKIVLATACLLLSMYGFLSLSFITAGILLAFGINFLSSEGSQINLTERTCRKVWTIAGLYVGNWKPCPEFEYVSVFRTNESQTVNGLGASATSRSSVILLNLFYNSNKHMTFYKTTDKEEALKVAHHFKMVFNIDILDATEPDKKWLD